MEELYLGIDVMILSQPLPLGIKGFLHKDRGVYYIYVNSNLSQEQQKRTICHEYHHLINDDLSSEDEAEEVERRNNERSRV